MSLILLYRNVIWLININPYHIDCHVDIEKPVDTNCSKSKFMAFKRPLTKLCVFFWQKTAKHLFFWKMSQSYLCFYSYSLPQKVSLSLPTIENCVSTFFKMYFRNLFWVIIFFYIASIRSIFVNFWPNNTMFFWIEEI